MEINLKFYNGAMFKIPLEEGTLATDVIDYVNKFLSHVHGKINDYTQSSLDAQKLQLTLYQNGIELKPDHKFINNHNNVYIIDEISPPIPDELICPLTGQIFLKPVLLPTCNETVEKECIKKWISEHATCPFTRQELEVKNLKLNIEMINKVNEFLIFIKIELITILSNLNNIVLNFY